MESSSKLLSSSVSGNFGGKQLVCNDISKENLAKVWSNSPHKRKSLLIKASAKAAPTSAENSNSAVLERISSYGTTSTLQKSIARPKLEELKDDYVDNDVQAFWDYQFLFLSQRSETVNPIELRVVEGSVPVDLEGTYYLSGPGLFADDHGSSVNPLDGHGYLRKFSIQSGSIFYSARYIDTEAREEEYDREKNTWRFTYRGPFSMLKGGERIGNVKVMKNVANTSVLNWAGHLMCLWEGGDPYKVDSQSLTTIGLLRLASETDDGRKENKPLNWKGSSLADIFKIGLLQLSAKVLHPILSGIFKMPRERMLSHYKIDAKRQRLIVMTCHAEDMVLPRSNFTVYEFDSSMNLLQEKQFVIYDHLMIHDWALTENHYIIFGNRIKLDIGGSVAAITGLTPMISALTVNPSTPHTPLYLLPRFSNQKQVSTASERDWRVPIPIPQQFWLMHTANAYEEIDANGNLNIVVQACISSYKWFSFKNMFGYDWNCRRLDPGFMNVDKSSNGELWTPHLVQVSVNLNPKDNTTSSAQVQSFKGCRKSCDFPAINPAVSGYKNRYSYVGAASGLRRCLQHFPFDTIVKLRGPQDSSSTWWAGKRSFVGEPAFVPRQHINASNFVEDDGYILVIQYAVWEQKCYLVILDAQRIGQDNALVAKLEVPKELSFPLGFHGFWVGGGKDHSMANSRVKPLSD